jgi:pimeloyl-ACP methyl ester carboxylesterase
VNDLRNLLDRLGIDRACLGGLSMGGNIALRFGLAHPGRVDGLVIANAGAGSDDPAAWRECWLALLV